MKFLIVSLALVALAAADAGQPIAILKQAQDISPEGTYSYHYETENGIHHSETGTQKLNNGETVPVLVANGEYHYTAPDGTPISVNYVADEYGFQPVGEHVPTIPPLIKKAIEYIQAHPPQAEHP